MLTMFFAVAPAAFEHVHQVVEGLLGLKHDIAQHDLPGDRIERARAHYEQHVAEAYGLRERQRQAGPGYGKAGGQGFG